MKSAILDTFHYFDIFNYPLTNMEVQKFVQHSASLEEIDNCLQQLVENNTIYQHDSFYGLNGDNSNADERIVLNQRAKKILPTGYRNGKLIMKFPFIKQVYISGSLSKGVYQEDDDIDYFLISSKNRIWISKFFLKLYKFIFLKNSYKEFCINYFISEDQLEIKEKNLYTATEIVTLLPIMESRAFSKMYAENHWVKDYFPNYELPQFLDDNSVRKPFLTKMVEFCFVGFIGNMADSMILKVNNYRTNRKYKKDKSNADFDLMFRSSKSESKQHPQNSQTRILSLLEKKKVSKQYM